MQRKSIRLAVMGSLLAIAATFCLVSGGAVFSEATDLLSVTEASWIAPYSQAAGDQEVIGSSYSLASALDHLPH
ncbi:hypothetical protein SAMN05444172_3362 [Burkholderia sp. GAS332]|nr:hypothetical protein SAMN05444172_3362 [Burkholderia sp. GAS332]